MTEMRLQLQDDRSKLASFRGPTSSMSTQTSLQLNHSAFVPPTAPPEAAEKLQRVEGSRKLSGFSTLGD